MTTAMRAVLALALLAGFYVLVAVVLAAAAALDAAVLMRGTGEGLGQAIAVTLAAFAVVRALYVVSRRKQGQEPGVAVTPEQEPMLWQAVTELAQRARTRPPDEIRLIGDVNAAVGEDTRLLGLRATRRYMYIGVPLLMTLTAAEMRAVLGHELGHYSGAHTRLGAPVYRGRAALVATIQGLEKHAFTRRIFLGYFALFMRVSQSVSRRQELEADELAAAVSGRAAAGSALRKVHAVAHAWDVFMGGYAGLIGPAQIRPDNLFTGFSALVSDPARQREISQAATDPGPGSPYDSHPSLAERLAAIGRLPEPAAASDTRPAASVLLRDLNVAARAVQETLWTEQARRLPVAPWEEIVARGMYSAANADPFLGLSVAGQQVMGAREPSLDAALEALARGRAAEVQARLAAMGWDEDSATLQRVLTRALEAVLIENNLARWTHSWSSSPRLLDRSGRDVELGQFAAAAVADPARQVPALREWLGRSGIPAGYRPRALAEASASRTAAAGN